MNPKVSMDPAERARHRVMRLAATAGDPAARLAATVEDAGIEREGAQERHPEFFEERVPDTTPLPATTKAALQNREKEGAGGNPATTLAEVFTDVKEARREATELADKDPEGSLNNK